MNTSNQWSKQKACFAHATQVWHQCHFWRMNLMFEVYCTGKWAWQLSIKFMSSTRLWVVAKILDSLMACFENVNMAICMRLRYELCLFTYELTADNVKKIIAIYMRFRYELCLYTYDLTTNDVKKIMAIYMRLKFELRLITYELTADNVKKIMAIYMRLKFELWLITYELKQIMWRKSWQFTWD